VVTDGKKSEKFRTYKSVRKRGALPPVIFNMTMDETARAVTREWNTKRLHI
jgi:hypothetical protein